MSVDLYLAVRPSIKKPEPEQKRHPLQTSSFYSFNLCIAVGSTVAPANARRLYTRHTCMAHIVLFSAKMLPALQQRTTDLFLSEKEEQIWSCYSNVHIV